MTTPVDHRVYSSPPAMCSLWLCIHNPTFFSFFFPKHNFLPSSLQSTWAQSPTAVTSTSAYPFSYVRFMFYILLFYCLSFLLFVLSFVLHQSKSSLFYVHRSFLMPTPSGWATYPSAVLWTPWRGHRQVPPTPNRLCTSFAPALTASSTCPRPRKALPAKPPVTFVFGAESGRSTHTRDKWTIRVWS